MVKMMYYFSISNTDKYYDVMWIFNSSTDCYSVKRKKNCFQSTVKQMVIFLSQNKYLLCVSNVCIDRVNHCVW